MEELTKGIIPEIIEQELILDGTNSNFRIKVQRYTIEDIIIDEIFEYTNPADDAGWSNVYRRTFKQVI